MSYLSHDYVFCVLDEIALEGLDGITLQGLWVRLSKRPNLCFESDSCFKKYIWNLIKRLKDVEMYELAEPRKDLEPFNRFQFVDPELGTVIDTEEEIEDIYPFNPIEDFVAGNRGSCSTYNDRQNVTITAKAASLEEANSRWGNKLVIVANQKTRTNALQGDNIDPVMELTLIQYCVLERIGRSRYHGEITIGKSSLQQVGIDAKSLFYIRKYLINHKLITKQIFHLKSGLQNSSGSLLHITRYFVLRRPKALLLTQKVVEILKSRPGHYAEYEEIRQLLGLFYSLKKLMKTNEFQRLIKTDLKLPYRTVYPEAKPGEWKLKAVDKEKMVRVIQLIKPDVDVEELWSKEEDDEDDSCNGILDQGKLVLDRPLLHHAYEIFVEAGPHGLSQHELGTLMGQTRLESRNICRNLVKCGLVSMYMQDVGRQRVTRFMSKKYSNQGEMSMQYEREKKKMLELLRPGTETSSLKEETNDEKADTVTSQETESGENIETKVIEDVVEPSKNNVYTGFQEDLLSVRWNQKKGSPAMSYRLLKRANLIMECVKTHKVIYDCKKLMQHINDEEEKEGYNVKIDKKTVFRLLSKLKKDGRIKYISINLRMNDSVRDLKFICEPSITKDDAVIQSAMEQAKVKFFVHHKDPNFPSASNSDKSKSELNPENKEKKGAASAKISIARITSQGKKYGFSPKFVRMKLLHRFLFYLIYGYEGEAGLDQSKLVEQIILDGNNMATDISKELPIIFFPTVCWKTFVPPLPKHSGFPDGWTFMSDWLLRIPLSLFVKIYNITYSVPMLEDYLSHPIRQHYLIKSLPTKMRKYLLLNRRYIFSIHEIVCRLCYIGLIQFGPQRLKEKDQVFIYLNRRATLLDTIPSHPGYHQVSADIKYEEYKYYFEKISDVDKYWYDMWNICIKTQLGGRMCVTGNNITLETLANKEAMIQSTQSRNSDEAPMCDIGFVPGDHRGAAGLDSAIFSHLKRNWNWDTLKKCGSKSGKQSEETNLRTAKFAQIKQGKEKLNIVDQLMSNSAKAAKPRKLAERFGKVAGLPRKRTLSTTVQNLCKRKIEKAKHVVRKVLPRKTRRPRPYYDEEDRKALSKMKKLRVDWSEMEDALLLNCKVAGLYLFPNPRYLAISFQTVRDVLHQTFKESKNKTSRACQRRILYMMRNAATAHSVSLSLLDLKHDPMINERFGGMIQKAKAIAKSREQLERLLRPGFMDLVNVLSKRMDSMPRSTTNEDLIPSSIEDLRSNYNIAFPHSLDTKSRFHDVNNIDDIQKGVLHTVIHSSFCCSADKTSWAYQLFKVYQQYPDNFIKASMNKFRTDQMITLKKQYSRYYKTSNFVPISSCPYQLSMNYAYLFQNEYQFEIYHQAYILLKKLQLFFTNQREGKVEMTSSDGGGTATLIELFSRNQATLEAVIPEQIIILDPVITEKKESYDGILKRFHKILEISLEDKGAGESSKSPLVGPAKRKNPPGVIKKETASKRRKLDGDGSSVADESGVEKVSSVEDENLLESKMLSSNASCTASRIALYMMRKELTESPNIDPHHAHDFFVVNSCEVYCNGIDLDTALEYVQCQATASEAVLQKIKSSTILPDEYCSLNTLYQIYIKECADESEWRFACEIMNFVGHGKEVGVTNAELREKFGRQQVKFSLSQHLKIMTRERVFVRVGITTIRYVHYEYTKPWVVHSNKLLRLQRENLNPANIKRMIGNDEVQTVNQAEAEDTHEDEEEGKVKDPEKPKETDEKVSSHPKPKGRIRRAKCILNLEKESECLEWNSADKIKVMIRPWVRVDGSLNRRVLDRFLGSVLGHVMQNPGCCIKALGTRFAPALQPCHTRELLEILNDLGCVKLMALQMKKPTLFSKPSKVVLVEPDGTEDESSLFITPQLDAVTKLGIFFGDKKYTADFLGNII